MDLRKLHAARLWNLQGAAGDRSRALEGKVTWVPREKGRDPELGSWRQITHGYTGEGQGLELLSLREEYGTWTTGSEGGGPRDLGSWV